MATLASIQSAVKGASSERAQVNAVVSALARAGYSGAANPEVHTTSVDRSTFRIYVWRNAIGGDALVLATGPNFQPAVMLGSQVPSTGGPGVYVQSLLAEGSSVKTLSGAGRAVGRIEKAAARVERIVTKVEKTATRVEKAARAVRAAPAPAPVVVHMPAPAPVYHAPAPVHHAPAPRVTAPASGGGGAADFIALLKQMKAAGQI